MHLLERNRNLFIFFFDISQFLPFNIAVMFFLDWQWPFLKPLEKFAYCVFTNFFQLDFLFRLSFQATRWIHNLNLCPYFNLTDLTILKVVSKNLSRNSTWQYCCVEKSVKFFVRMLNKSDFLFKFFDKTVKETEYYHIPLLSFFFMNWWWLFSPFRKFCLLRFHKFWLDFLFNDIFE